MINRDNYQAVAGYLKYFSEVMQRDRETVKRSRIMLAHLLRWADETPFTQATTIRPVFPKYVSGSGLVAVGVKKVCIQARVFFRWIHADNPKRYAELTPAWIETLQPPRMPDEPRKEHEAVTLDMVRALLRLPNDDIGIRRDKAAAAFLFLSGMRATAFCTLPIRCVNVADRKIMQYPTMGVMTKNRKSAVTYLLDIPDLLAVVGDWDQYVRSHLPDSAPWYPVISLDTGDRVITDYTPGSARSVILRKRITALFERAGLAPLSPHKFRHGFAVYGLNLAKTVPDLKAVSQNLMHSSMGVTDGIYSILNDDQMQSRIANLGHAAANPATMTDEIAAIVAEVMRIRGT